jgi:hypothetical protein
LKKLLRTCLVLIGMFLAIGGFFGFRLLDSNSQPKGNLKYESITKGNVIFTVSATGTLEPEDVVDVGAQVAGMITDFGIDADGKPVDYGSKVSPGTILARIGETSPIEQTLRVNNTPMRIIGVLSKKGANTFRADQDDIVLAPWQTIKFKIAGQSAQTTNQTAGVGIMNIMLVSVTERTKEIGLRMAVGARPQDILRQFLVEAMVLCLLGGAIGAALGRASSWMVETFLRWRTEPSILAVVAAVGVSALVGVVFSFYPAWKVSRMDPIEALRYE